MRLQQHHAAFGRERRSNYFLYPVKNQLESQIKELLAQIKLEKYRENLPVAIAIADRNKTSGEKSDGSVQDAVQKVAKALLIDAVFQAESEIYYILYYSSCRSYADKKF